jgi:hypothetical protein
LEAAKGISFGHGTGRRGEAAPRADDDFEVNVSTAARLGRAAQPLIGEAIHPQTTPIGHARQRRTCPVSSIEMQRISIEARYER